MRTAPSREVEPFLDSLFDVNPPVWAASRTDFARDTPPTRDDERRRSTQTTCLPRPTLYFQYTRAWRARQKKRARITLNCLFECDASGTEFAAIRTIWVRSLVTDQGAVACSRHNGHFAWRRIVRLGLHPGPAFFVVDTATSYTLDFDGADGGKNARYLLRPVNSTGQMGPQTKTASVTIGA